MSDLQADLLAMGDRAKTAARALVRTGADDRNRALLAMAHALGEAEAAILAANANDLTAAAARQLPAALVDRLRLDPKRLAAMADGIRKVAQLPDPVGRVLREWAHENALVFQKVAVPIGVIGIIYESRPNVTSDAAALCLKSGNAVILRGGSESLASNRAIAAALRAGLQRAGVMEDAVQLVPVADRAAVQILCGMDRHLDLVIPRGGRSLIEAVVAGARVPVIKHFDGICALYIDRAADFSKALSIALNAKCQRPGVCNAIETLLVHRAIAAEFLPRLAQALGECGVELRCDETARALLENDATRRATKGRIVGARDEDFRTEFLDLVLAVKIVETVDDAIDHIARHGSRHSDAIVTEDRETAERFLAEVDSATVYWNASTRFTDGGEFGFGAEIGISTDKLHARGPMGLEELTTYKYVMRGNGQVRP